MIPDTARNASAQGLSEAERIMPLPPIPELFRLLTWFDNSTEWHCLLDNGVTDKPDWEQALASISLLAAVVMAR